MIIGIVTYFLILCYIGYLPKEFLNNAEREELDGKVIIRLHWLILIMKEIMKLDSDEDNPGIKNSFVLNLEKSGVADKKLLKTCWEKYLSHSPGKMELRHVCLVLQAYCLIYPIAHRKAGPVQSASCVGHSEAEPEQVDNGGTLAKVEKKYLIPCKLPQDYPKECLDAMESRHSWFSFYFDFDGFLPAEIYHRLVCKLLQLVDPDAKRSKRPSCFSKTECIINDVEKKDWKVRHKESDHVLEVSVIG